MTTITFQKLADLTDNARNDKKREERDKKDIMIKHLNEYLDMIFPTLEDLKTNARKGKNNYLIFRVDPFGKTYIKDDIRCREVRIGKISLKWDWKTSQSEIINCKKGTISIKYAMNYLLNKSIEGLGKPKKSIGWILGIYLDHEIYYRW